MKDHVKFREKSMRSFFKNFVIILGIIVVIMLVSAMTTSYSLSGPAYQGAESDHFNGEKFVNPDPVERPGTIKAMMYFLTAKLGAWREWTENKQYPVPPLRIGKGDLRATFINHATVLIQMDGLNILTDPIWSDRCSPVSWTGPKRKRAPGIALENLPPIDVVLISHNHYDHLDIPTLKRLADDHHPRIIAGLGNKALLEKAGITNVVEMDWEDSIKLTDEIKLHGLPARHFSSRGMFDQDATLWLSFVIEGPAGAVYFAGDTGFGSHFEEAAKKFGSFRLALLPIGAYLPRWFMGDIHMSPQEAVRAHQILRASTSIGIHFGTFQLSAESQDQPVEELHEALEKAGNPRPRFWVLDFGEGQDIPHKR